MRMNDSGFLAMMDALMFIAVIIVACSVVAGMDSDGGDDGSEASELLESLVSSKVRLSDLSEGDDTIVRLSDLMALHAVRGSEPVEDYISDVLTAFTGGAPFLLTIEYTAPESTDAPEPISAEIGTHDDFRESAERTVPMSTGGTVRVVLSLMRWRIGNKQDDRTKNLIVPSLGHCGIRQSRAFPFCS